MILLVVPLAVLIMAVIGIMAWGAVANLIHVSRIIWRFLADSTPGNTVPK